MKFFISSLMLCRFKDYAVMNRGDCVKAFFLPRRARRTRRKRENFLGNFDLRELPALRGLLKSLFLHNP